MPNIVIQDLNASIMGTSKYGAGYDTVHVETLINTDVEIPSDMNWYIPVGTSIPNEVYKVFSANKIDLYPQTENSILNGTEDILEQAKSNNFDETYSDAARLLLRSVMKLSSLEKVPKATNCYLISYEYKLYPSDDGSFQFKVVMPFDGLSMINGTSLVQTTVTCPIQSKIDSVRSYGSDPNGTIVTEETVHAIDTEKPVVTFRYRQDPTFVITYNY